MNKNATNTNLVEDLGVSIKKRAEILDQTKWVHDFSWIEIETLATYLRLNNAVKNSVILKEGVGEHFLAIIVHGTVGIYKQDPENHLKELAIIGPGQTIGEMSMIDGSQCSATVIATDNLSVLTMSKTAMNNLINEKPNVAIKFILKIARILSQRLRMTSSNLVDLL
ncbi:Cyclic nucleotide-binding protein [Gammaproteobacteria bacterium]